MERDFHLDRVRSVFTADLPAPKLVMMNKLLDFNYILKLPDEIIRAAMFQKNT
jgi:hypothetical protein